MADKIFTLTRKELFDKVWKTPIQRLAKEFNISDVGLAKICKRYNIPRPGIGYWRKKETGKTIIASTLPPLQDDHEPVIQFRVDENYHQRLISANEYKKVIAQQIVPPDSVKEYKHPVTLKSHHYLSKGKPDNTGIVKNKTYPVDHIQVSQESISRSLRILDAILLSLELNQCKVTWKSAHDGVSVTRNGISIAFNLYDKVNSEEVDTPPSKQDSNNQHTILKPRYKYTTTGRLIFKLKKYNIASGVRSIWTDSKYKSIEYYTPDIVANTLLMADVILQRQRSTLANEIRKAIESEKNRELYIEQHIYDEKMEFIFKIYKKWKKFNSFRKFAQELAASVYAYHFENDLDDSHNELVKMAEYHLKQIDPFSDIDDVLEEFNDLNDIPGWFHFE